MFAGNVVQIGLSIVSTAELSNAACERPFLTRIMPVLSLSKICYLFGNANNFFKRVATFFGRTNANFTAKSQVSNLFGQILQPLLWPGLPATNVKITTSGVSSLLSYGAIFI